jgi:hypothetical protein
MGPINPFTVTFRHECSPTHLRGHVSGTYSAIKMTVQPLGMISSGYLIEGIGLLSTVILFATSLQLLAIAMLAIPVVCHIERPSAVSLGSTELSHADR